VCTLGSGATAAYASQLDSGLVSTTNQSFPNAATGVGYWPSLSRNVTCPHSSGEGLVVLAKDTYRLLLLQIDAGVDIHAGYSLSLDTCASVLPSNTTRMTMFVGTGCPSSGWNSLGCMAAS
jgi:hypothetical protein